ncbi:THAP domain-containing protein 8 [Porphyrio hochstetteri]
MPKYCRAPRCANAAGRARPPGRRLGFYKFPLHDAPRLRQWLTQMRRENWVPTRHQHLCSDHFEPSCFQYRWGVRYLRPDAVPTIFPKGESPDTSPGAACPEQPLPASAMEPVMPGQPPTPQTTALGAVIITPAADSTMTSPLLIPPSLVEPGDSCEGVPSSSQPAPARVTALLPSTQPEQPSDAAVALPAAEALPHLQPVAVPPVPAPQTAASSALPSPFVSTIPIVSQTATPTSPPVELSTEELVAVMLVLQRKVKVLQQRQRRHRARLEAMEGLAEQLRCKSLRSKERLGLVGDGSAAGRVTSHPSGVMSFSQGGCVFSSG